MNETTVMLPDAIRVSNNIYTNSHDAITLSFTNYQFKPVDVRTQPAINLDDDSLFYHKLCKNGRVTFGLISPKTSLKHKHDTNYLWSSNNHILFELTGIKAYVVTCVFKDQIRYSCHWEESSLRSLITRFKLQIVYSVGTYGSYEYEVYQLNGDRVELDHPYIMECDHDA